MLTEIESKIRETLENYGLQVLCLFNTFDVALCVFCFGIYISSYISFFGVSIIIRKLWITRINAACRMNDISYSKFINGLSKAGVEINRKMLSEVAIDNFGIF